MSRENFRNDLEEAVRYRLNDDDGKVMWKTIKPGESAFLPAGYGERLKLTPLAESGESKKDSGPFSDPKTPAKVEPNANTNANVPPLGSFDDEIKAAKEFKKKLIAVKGIADATAKDVINVYKTEEDLIKAIKSGDELPFEKDIVKVLKKAFNKA